MKAFPFTMGGLAALSLAWVFGPPLLIGYLLSEAYAWSATVTFLAMLALWMLPQFLLIATVERRSRIEEAMAALEAGERENLAATLSMQRQEAFRFTLPELRRMADQ